jgi:hypothetical protein
MKLVYPSSGWCEPGRAAIAGMTLIELMISVGIGTLLIAGVIIMTNITLKQGMLAIGNYSDLNAKSRQALDYMSRDIRGSAQMTAYSASFISLTNLDGTAVSYVWDGSNLVTRTYAGSSSVMLTNCDFLSFNIYQRNPTNNFSFYTTTNLTQAKLVDVSWRCSRKYLGAQLNTESVQTARIVIRN